MLKISEFMEHSYNVTGKYVQASIKNVRSWTRELLAAVLEVDLIIKDQKQLNCL